MTLPYLGMNSGRFAFAIIAIILLSLCPSSLSGRLIHHSPNARGATVYVDVLRYRKNEDSFCESWKFSVEANGAGAWAVVPKRCVDFVKKYMNEERYRSDSEVVADYALEYAKTVNISGDGKDIWIFDVDETLLSNLPYYANHGYGSEAFEEDSFNEWVDSGEASALPASLRLFTQLQQLGFKIFLLTGRTESEREITDKNLKNVGFTNYEKLILRGDSDLGKAATLYKSEKRQELVDGGYKIYGSSGDQWSDLWGSATAERSFKLPNPMYYIP